MANENKPHFLYKKDNKLSRKILAKEPVYLQKRARMRREEVLVSVGNGAVWIEELAGLLGVPFFTDLLGRFPDGETRICFKELVINKKVCVLCCPGGVPVHDRLLQVYLLARALKRQGVQELVLIMPYLSYARQAQADKDIAALLELAGVGHLICLDVHDASTQQAFSRTRLQSLSVASLFANELHGQGHASVTLVAPDAGAARRVEALQASLALKGLRTHRVQLSKHRDSAGGIHLIHSCGQMGQGPAVIVDDLCDTGQTLAHAAACLKNAGALEIQALVTHAVCSPGARERIDAAPLNRFITTQSCPLPNIKGIRVLPIAPLLRDALVRIEMVG